MVEKSSFLKRLEDSGLATEFLPEVRELISSGTTDSDVAEELINRRILTDYQSRSLLEDSGAVLVIGEYEVLDQIGRGGMGYVVKARHRTMDRLVAIKFILPNYTESEDVRQRFEREVKAAAKLEHPNIVTAYDAGSMGDGSHYLVMRYVEGKDLSTRVREEAPLSVAAAINVICQTARGLAYAHEQGIVHRDIKPANLLLDPQGVVRILDMGLARMRATPGDDAPDGLTNTGSMMGTVDYMAPEQAMDARSADHRADIYSLGCTLFFLLMGRAPYASESMMSRLLAHREGPVPLLSSVLSGIPPELESIYTQMMAKDRKQRYQSMDEVIAALSAIEVEEDDTSALSTLEFPDDGSGGFIQLSDAAHQQATVVPNHDSKPTIPTGSRPQGQPTAPAATILETASGLEGAAALTQPDDTEPPTTAETICETPSQLSTSEPQPTTTSHGRRTLIAGIVAATGLVALLIIVFGRDLDPNGASDEKGGNPGSATVGQTGPKSVTESGEVVVESQPLDFALVFPPVGKALSIESVSLDVSKPFTVEAFFEQTGEFAGRQYLLGIGSVFVECQSDANNSGQTFWIGSIRDADLVAHRYSAPRSDSGPVHVAVVRDQSTLRLFVNGVETEKSLELRPKAAAESEAETVSDLSRLGVPLESSRLKFGRPKVPVLIDEVRISDVARYDSTFTPEPRFEPDVNTVALYHCDEDNGDVLIDSSGNDHHGKIIGAKWVPQSLPSSAVTETASTDMMLRVQGESEYAVVFDSLTVDTREPLTVEAIVQVPDIARGISRPVFRIGPLYLSCTEVWQSPENQGFAWFSNVRGKTLHASLSTRREVHDGRQPVHIAIICSDSRLQLFVKGVKCNERIMVRPIGANTNSHEPSDDPIEFAAPSQATRWGYDKVGILNAKISVLIDEFRISSVARYKSDFKPPTRFEPDEHTLALYHCDEGKGDILIDSSGNDHHGKIIEATWVSRSETDIPVVPRESDVPAEPE